MRWLLAAVIVGVVIATVATTTFWIGQDCERAQAALAAVKTAQNRAGISADDQRVAAHGYYAARYQVQQSC